jgi:hypothetical protein
VTTATTGVLLAGGAGPAFGAAPPIPSDQIDFQGRPLDTGPMGVRTRGLDIKAGAAKLKADRAARAEAEAVIQRWNDQLSRGRDMLWAPTIRAALIAGTPWLDVFCPGAGQSISARSTVTRWLRSARWCSACGAHGVQGRRRCRSCSASTRCRRLADKASPYEDVRRGARGEPILRRSRPRHRVGARLEPHGIEIETVQGQGWRMGREARELFSAQLAPMRAQLSRPREPEH